MTINTRAPQSVVRPDIVTDHLKSLKNVSLRTAIGKLATVYGKVEIKLLTFKSINHAFTVAYIVDEVIIGADFMKKHDINLCIGQQIMIWHNVTNRWTLAMKIRLPQKDS